MRFHQTFPSFLLFVGRHNVLHLIKLPSAPEAFRYLGFLCPNKLNKFTTNKVLGIFLSGEATECLMEEDKIPAGNCTHLSLAFLGILSRFNTLSH